MIGLADHQSAAPVSPMWMTLGSPRGLLQDAVRHEGADMLPRAYEASPCQKIADLALQHVLGQVLAATSAGGRRAAGPEIGLEEAELRW
jgi:hypothetical protein